jgi:hypothetical protein
VFLVCFFFNSSLPQTVHICLPSQWDDDFIFDAPAPAPAQRKRGGSSATGLTAHLSTTNPTLSKEKRKSAASAVRISCLMFLYRNVKANRALSCLVGQWSNAFKKIESDPRQAGTKTTTTATHSKSSAQTSNSTTTTVVHSHGAAPLQSNAEFAYFDSEDQVGFQKPSRAYYTPEVDEPSVYTEREGDNNLQMQPPTRQPSGEEGFDDGLGDSNLGFEDDDYIPNVGFDEEEVYVPGVPRPAQQVAQPPAPRYSAHSGNTSTISSWQNSSTRSSEHSSGTSGSVRPYTVVEDEGPTECIPKVPQVSAAPPSLRLKAPQQLAAQSLHSPTASHTPHRRRSNSMNSDTGAHPTPNRASPHHSRATSTSSVQHQHPPSYHHSRDTSTSSIQLQQQLHQQQQEQRQALDAMIESDLPLSFEVFESTSGGASGGNTPVAMVAGRRYPHVAPMVRSADSQDGDSRQSAPTSGQGHHRQQAHLQGSSTGPMVVGHRAMAEPVTPSLSGMPSPGVSVKDRVRQYERREYLTRQDSPPPEPLGSRPLPELPGYSYARSNTSSNASAARSNASSAAPSAAPSVAPSAATSAANSPRAARSLPPTPARATSVPPRSSLPRPLSRTIVPDADHGSLPGSPELSSRSRSRSLSHSDLHTGKFRSRSHSHSHSDSVRSRSRSPSRSHSGSDRSRSRSGSGSHSSGSYSRSHSGSDSGSDHQGSEYFSGSDQDSNSDVFSDGSQVRAV